MCALIQSCLFLVVCVAAVSKQTAGQRNFRRSIQAKDAVTLSMKSTDKVVSSFEEEALPILLTREVAFDVLSDTAARASVIDDGLDY